MRTDLSTIQQTLMPEAAGVLNQSIAEAARRNHGQTTPLHVAATLLAAPSGFLRQACIRSHPNSSHPLQCRALELCFSVALERLPTASAAEPPQEPPISNALMAALKRSQAHQRRGCPELQQQPLLAVKVELEQLIISILDDPSVSRVMREASFSSPAVKAAVEQSLNSNNSPNPTPPTNGLGLRRVPVPGPPNRNLYLNPRLQQPSTVQSGQQRANEVKRVVDIMGRAKKRNPVLVGDSDPGRIVSEIQNKIENRAFQDGPLKDVQMIQLKEFSTNIQELGGLIETRIGNSDPGGFILNLGDLKWLVEQNNVSGATQPSPVAVEVDRSAVAELRKLLDRFGERLWFIGSAACQTYLRCQVEHPSMENDLDLEALPVAAKTPPSGMPPRLGNNGILSIEQLSPFKNFTALNTKVYEKAGPARGTMNCCPQCLQNYQQELSKIEASSSEIIPETAQLKQLPQWLQNAKAGDQLSSTKIPELQKKYNKMCLRFHPSYHHKLGPSSSERIVLMPPSVPPGFYNPNLLLHQSLQPKLESNRNLFVPVQLNSDFVTSQTTEQAKSPTSPVRTELVLGRSKAVEPKSEKIQVKDFLSSVEQNNSVSVLQSEKLGKSLDVDLFKKLTKGLSNKIWWQHDAASVVAATVSQCKLGKAKRRGIPSKGDVWLLFSGPDRVGKKKMALALSELVYGTNPIIINLGSRRDGTEDGFSFRGKTALDKLAETVRKSPFSVIMLEDIDEADLLLCGSIKRAMERGRLSDSHGREISLGNIIFVLTANWGMLNGKNSLSDDFSSGVWSLRLCLSERASKRRPSWLYNNGERPLRPRKENGSGLSFDLNEAADAADDDRPDGSHNSSDLTVDRDQEDHGLVRNKLSLQYVPFVFHDLVGCVDDAVVFRPVDFSLIKQNVTNLLSKRFKDIIGGSSSLEIEDDAVEKIAGGVRVGQMGLKEWIDGAIVPILNHLKSQLSSRTHSDRTIARLELDDDYSDDRSSRDLLPNSIRLVVD